MRVATYTRISTDEEHQPYSLEAQHERLGAYIRSQDSWELAKHYTDQMTGSVLERPDLQRALADGRLHRFDLLLVYRVDRLSRSVRGLAQILEELDQAGVTFRSATEPFDTGSPAGRMMVQMLGVFAEFERATLIDRVVAGMERKAARGGWHGGPPPYGYRINTNAGALEPDAVEAPLLPVMFELCANDRLGARSIAMWLNDHGHRTRTGRAWSHKSVLAVLRNHVYVGEIVFRGSQHPAQHEPLLSRDLFDGCQAILDERGEDHSRRASNPSVYLLAGLLKCERCGSRLVGNAAHGKRCRYRYYTCSSRQRYGRHGCQAKRVPAEQIDAAVIESILRTYSDAGFVRDALAEAAARSAAARPQVADQLAAARTELARAEERRDRYFRAFEAGTLPEEDCGERIRSITQRIGELRARVLELEDAAAEEPSLDVSQPQLSEIVSAVREALEMGTPAQRKALIKTLVAEIRVNGDEAFPFYRLPTGSVRIVGTLVDPRGFEPLTF